MGIEIDNKTVFNRWAPALPRDIRILFFKDGHVSEDGVEPTALTKSVRKAEVTDIPLLFEQNVHEVQNMGRARALKICSWLSSDTVRGAGILQEIIQNGKPYSDIFRETMTRFSISIGPRIARGIFSNGSSYIVDRAIHNQLEINSERKAIRLVGKFYGADAEKSMRGEGI